MAKKAETYEAMAERLQGIADKLSDGNLPLEEMLSLIHIAEPTRPY